MNLNVRRQDLVVKLLSFCFDCLKDVLSLLAAQHENDALDGIVIFLEAEFAQAWCVPDCYISYITHSDGHALVGAHHNVSDVVRVPDQTDTANVVELSALRIKAASSIRVVGRQSSRDLWNGQVVPIDARRVEQYLVL